MPIKKNGRNLSKSLEMRLEITEIYFEHQLKLLNEFQSLKFEQWEVNWNEIEKFQGKNNAWSTLNIFKVLESNKHLSAIYYFDSPQNLSNEIHSSYRIFKKQSNSNEYKNICSVPKYSHETSCLYVGSVDKDLYDRLICHLGYGHPTRHALFLSQVLSTVKNPQKIHFNYFFFKKKFRWLNFWAELELQSRLKPLLGLNNFVKKGAYFNEAYTYEYNANNKLIQ